MIEQACAVGVSEATEPGAPTVASAEGDAGTASGRATGASGGRAPVRLEIERVPGAEDLPLPRYMSEGASGLDVAAACLLPLRIEPGRWALVPTGLRLSAPVGYEVQVRARSGLAARHGLVLMNGVGTVDADYRGEVQVILGNLGREPFEVQRGMRIAQLVVCRVERALVIEVGALAGSPRGQGGFGSTGV